MGKQSAKCARCHAAFEIESTADSRVVCPHCGAALALSGTPKPAPRPDPLIGTRMADFEIVELIGRGGMGSVYKARQVSLDRFVALKVLAGALSRDAAFVARFGREARAAAAVEHPNIIRVIAIGVDQGRPYMAMELVEGETLSAILRREGRLPGSRAVGLMKQAAAALAQAHALGIVHRDIKPSNVLVQADGLVKVADFGLAKRTEGDVEVTQVGTTLGTPLYMAPEVAAGKPAEPRSDLYSLGATFYHVVAGRPPFQGTHPAELAIKHVNEPVPPLAELAPDTPRELCFIIHRLLRKKVNERFSGAAELLKALNRPGAESGVASPESARTAAITMRPWALRKRPSGPRAGVIALVGGCVGLAAIVLAIWALSGPRDQARAPEGPRPAAAATVPPPAVQPQPPAPPPKADPREKEAEDFFRRAAVAVAAGRWSDAKAALDWLERDYAATRVCSAQRAAMATLRAKAEAGLALEVAPEAPPDPAPPKPAVRPEGPGDKLPAQKEPPPEAARSPGKFFHGSVRPLANGRLRLHYDFSDPTHLRDWQITAGPVSRLVGGEVLFGGPNGNSLMHVASFVGDVEVIGSWRILRSFQAFCDLSVNFCNAGGRYYAVSLMPTGQRIFKDNGNTPALASRAANCPNGVAHTFRIAREGVWIRVAVDGESRAEATDRDYTRGAVGLGAWFAVPAVKAISITGRLDPDWLAANPDAAKQIEALRAPGKGD